MFNIIGTIIFGAVIGFIAKHLSNNEHISTFATVGLGVLGVVIANLILQATGYPADTRGIDWIRWGVAILSSIVVIGAYVGLTGRKK